jgi:hypothetical protein
MSHLELHDFFEIIGGQGPVAKRRHVEECDGCRRELEAWRVRVGDIRLLEANPVDASEFHQLRVLFRELGPDPGSRSWVARLVSGLQPSAAAAVRGGLSSTLTAFEAGPYEVILQIRPSDTKGRFDLQGQVTSGEEQLPSDSSVVVSSDLGHADRAAVDSFGEFHFGGVPEGTCRLVWYGKGVRVELDGFTVGEPDGFGLG